MQERALEILRAVVEKKVIETPCYVYDYGRLLSNIRVLKRHFHGMAKLYFAVKANTNLSLLRIIKQQGVGAEVVSPGEIFICLRAGFKAEEILYNNVARKAEEILYALDSGVIFFGFESIGQAMLLENEARKRGRTIKVFARVNPGIFPMTHPHLSTGSKFSKFGMTIEEMKRSVAVIKKFKYAELIGIHCHIGSQILSPEPFVRAIKKVRQAIGFFRKNGFKIHCVNLGGGFGVPYQPQEKPLNFKPIVDAYDSMRSESHVDILLEPGRFFVANAGYILTRLIDKKIRNHTPLYMIDAGMTENPRPALYDAYHHIKPLFDSSHKMQKVRVTGPLCENADEFGCYHLPNLQIGDYLLIHNCGAYTRTMGSNYNGRLLPAEHMIIDNQLRVIRRKQALRRLIEDEQYQGF